MTFRRRSRDFLSDKKNKLKNTVSLKKLQKKKDFSLFLSQIICKLTKRALILLTKDFFRQNRPIKTL